ncbi:hypothetical protein [Phaeovulum vinaykumarii]|uniref:Uncharacterized protein n=1 Tax=Phaeovulum vinaykumarii TaxID=407234 RepID=A0A1N7MU23_9RHOB|nr:hypothetical protein [Phaeovulum vinaykumarii]SIS89637.1 hypothetical protein SAMN05421795_11013 [Phaeovulum vinaykumarii]SOC18316.1 hypothetical protein SAMN05878426_11412 [Phaeovulum vinaykumarii]
MSVLSYLLDQENRIVATGGGWDDAALSSGGAGAVSEAVVGLPLRDFVSGSASWSVLNALLYQSRLSGKRIKLDYRCDTVDAARAFRMFLVPGTDGMVLSSHHLLWSRPAKLRRLYRTAAENEPAVERCSFCNSVRRGPFWTDEVLNGGVHPATGQVEAVVYDVCPACREMARKAVDGHPEGILPPDAGPVSAPRRDAEDDLRAGMTAQVVPLKRAAGVGSPPGRR